MIAVVDYKMGNLLSVERGLCAALDSLGRSDVSVLTTSDAKEIASAQAIVLPGVGAFADAAKSMRDLGQMDVITQRIKDGVPFLGICLGLHLLCEFGVEGAALNEEGKTAGMGFLRHTVHRLPACDEQGNTYKIPHVGWNTVSVCDKPDSKQDGVENLLFEGIKQDEYFYFTHSYFVPVCEQTIATTKHSITMSSAVSVSKRAFAVQFHPEKSSDVGAKLLKNFVRVAFA